jgi:(4S)-4-hydroxy-5-phosphonooxypentane-2,3-dione isomerase
MRASGANVAGMTYIVSVRIRIKPGTQAAFEAATFENHRNTRLEPGNLRFDVLKHESDAEHYHLYEAYGSVDDFKAHQQTAHYHAWRAAVADMMAEPRVGEKFTAVFPQPWA